jgi:hypothetical protein
MNRDQHTTPSPWTGRAFVEPAAVRPCQLVSRSRHGEPERRLMLAVLTDAIETYLRRDTATTSQAVRRELREVRNWIGSDDATWPFSFLNVCHGLGIEPTSLRRGLRDWQQRGVSGEEPGGPASWRRATSFRGRSSLRMTLPDRRRGPRRAARAAKAKVATKVV